MKYNEKDLIVEEREQLPVWNKEEQPKIIGTLIKTKTGRFEKQDFDIDVDGVKTRVWGSSSTENDIQELDLKKGDILIFSYEGKARNEKTGRDFDKTTVRRAKVK